MALAFGQIWPFPVQPLALIPFLLLALDSGRIAAMLSFFLFFLLKLNLFLMQNANENFGSSNGSENFYCHRPSLMMYTDGVKDLAESCQAYWLIDLVISYQCHQAINLERFQVWDLKRVKNNHFKIVATDGNDNQIASQEIPFSDFNYDLATLWLVDGCLMLPKEY
jgi:hypothetical protein